MINTELADALGTAIKDVSPPWLEQRIHDIQNNYPSLGYSAVKNIYMLGYIDKGRDDYDREQERKKQRKLRKRNAS